ncbi:MAG TPA: hypothetical protein VJ852_02900 [Gemmatimonadaceae bacterium]|nr:hypothetical protein [Gemmatimonadaceae bacterium]
MSGAARFDIRLPIGVLFLLLGGVLTIFGIVTKSDTQLYARSENLSINLWWGLVMLIFGALMFYFGKKAKERPLHSAAGDETERREHVTGLEHE